MNSDRLRTLKHVTVVYQPEGREALRRPFGGGMIGAYTVVTTQFIDSSAQTSGYDTSRTKEQLLIHEY